MNARLLSLAVLASLGALAAPGWAKDKPAPDWAVEAAKIPTPVFVKDASAVLLSDEYLITVDTQNNAVERERWAIRILKPQGRGRAHCSIGYDVDQKLNYFRAWTIKADGAQIQAQDSDFSDHGGANSAVLLFTERTRTLNPPANDPGSVVVCETEEQLRPYVHEEDWDFQHSIPVVSEALEIDLPPGVAHAESWRKFTPVAPLQPEPNHLRWEIKEVPALNLEDIHATPAWSALSARMAYPRSPILIGPATPNCTSPPIPRLMWSPSSAPWPITSPSWAEKITPTSTAFTRRSPPPISNNLS